MYHYQAELVVKSYMPKSLEIGMYFVNSTEYEVLLWKLDHIPNDMNQFIKENGAPVELYILEIDPLNEKNIDILASPHEIGWFDEGEDSDMLSIIDLDIINLIINEYNGQLEIEIVEKFFDEDEQIIPNMIDEKVVIRLLTDDLEDYEEEF